MFLFVDHLVDANTYVIRDVILTVHTCYKLYIEMTGNDHFSNERRYWAIICHCFVSTNWKVIDLLGIDGSLFICDSFRNIYDMDIGCSKVYVKQNRG